MTASGGLAVLALLAWGAAGAARADEGDPPGRVARLSDIEGAVSLQPAGLPDWVAAPLNRPITTGDRLWSDQGSRAELDLGDAAVRLGSTTGFSFLNLDDVVAQMQLSAGTLIVDVRAVAGHQVYEIDTPNAAVTVQQPGEYRVEVNDAGDATTVKVSEGAAQASAGAETILIGMQQQVTFTGTNTLTYTNATLGPPDDLDNWSAAREREEESSSSAEYVADDVPGTQDLDNNGRWEDTPDYGYAWVPTLVAAGWVPYRFGHWVWIAPWGWTWIDAAPWGYAPFHYGRWVEWHGSWCWVPGPRGLRPVYAPALVAWVGGPSVATSPAFGNGVAWFPLAPRELYLPANRVSAAYLRSVNSTNTIVSDALLTSISQGHLAPTRYLNNRPAAVTLVPESVFLSGQRVGARAVTLPAPVLAGGTVTATAPAIAPTRRSVLGEGDGQRAVQPPAALLQRTLIVRRAPPRAPVPFDRQLAAIEANDGRPLTQVERARLQPPTPAVPVRVIGAAAPLSAGAALTARGSTSSGSAAGSAAPAAEPAPISLADRERLLENSAHLPPPVHSNTGAPPAQPINTYPPPAAAAADSSPPSRSDRPPWTQGSSPPGQQRTVAADDPTHTRGRPTSIPVYQPPGGADPGTPDVSVQSDDTSRHTSHAPAPRPAAPVQPASHPPAAARKKSSGEPRESAAHGDRESRERMTR
jgi:hypothetical protein